MHKLRILLYCLLLPVFLYAETPENPPFFTVWARPDSTCVDENLTFKGVRPRVGLVLSGGGAKGIAHIGALKVIEELGIPIDYVGGTSMGSIVGGLYAYGYSARELDSIFCNADWGFLLNDKPDWTDVFYEDKKNYMLTLPFSFKGDASIAPAGFLKGQHINNLFYTLSSQAYRYKTFNDFNKPYFCAVANVANGRVLYLDSGNLAMSMRGSMAVPGVFAPVKMDSMLLVDGGVLNNFPVDEMRRRGADIVIGVDVSYIHEGTAHINNFVDVLEEVMFMGSKNKVAQNRSSCDIYIRPDISGLGTTSFGKADTLVARGEAAARNKETCAALKNLLAELQTYQSDAPKEKKPYLPPQQVFVSRIEYNGLKIYNENYINQFLQVEPGKWTALKDITSGIDRLYGTLVFNSVTYEFKRDPDRYDAVILTVNVEESPLNNFNIGVRYDNDRSAALLAGLELRNFGFKNSTLSADIELSKMISAKVDYMLRPGWKPRKKNFSSLWMPSMGLTFEYHRISSYLYRDSVPVNVREASSEITSNRYKVHLYGQSNWKRNVLGLGIAYEFADNRTTLQENKTYNRGDIFSNSYIYPYFYFRHDSYNKKHYPTKGSKMNLEVSFPVSVDGSRSAAAKAGTAKYFLSAYWTADFAVGFGKNKRFCLYPGFTLGSILFHKNTMIPVQQQFFQGSCSDMPGWYNSVLPGVKMGQSSGYEIINLRLSAQYMIYKNLYISLRGGVGKAEYELMDMIRNFKHMVYGGNIGISYNTPVGPVGISFETSNVNPFNVYLNIGYWF